ncbi:hypothetical protein ACFVXH_39795 [Kitasatospora sp. NPDC058184]|uniref:hypothetical protein n=1 Tax=Kitasatospora sp. NPDC058184 TaxID=3346370 RepID=UPI0036D8D317
MSETTTGAAWRPLLEELGETFNGCTLDNVTESVGLRPEATAWLAAEAVTSTEKLAEALACGWSLHTTEQVGAVAAALLAVEHHVAQAKRNLLGVLNAMESRGDIVELERAYDGPDAPPAVATGLFKLEPSPQAADRLFAEVAAVPMRFRMPETFVEALHQIAGYLPDLVVPGSTVDVHEDADDPQHQAYLQLRHNGQAWRLGFYAEEWFLDNYPVEPTALVELGYIPLVAAHPAKLAEAFRTALLNPDQA